MALLQPELVKRRAAIAELRSATCNTLTSGACLSSSLEGFMLPSSLQTSAVSTRFRQGLDGVTPQNCMTVLQPAEDDLWLALGQSSKVSQLRCRTPIS